MISLDRLRIGSRYRKMPGRLQVPAVATRDPQVAAVKLLRWRWVEDLRRASSITLMSDKLRMVMTTTTEAITVQLANMAMRKRWLRIEAASRIQEHSKGRTDRNHDGCRAAAHGLVHGFRHDDRTK